MKHLTFLLLFFVSAIIATSHALDDPIINSGCGPIQGKWTPDGSGSYFLGIPYAEAPVNDKRFERCDAVTSGPLCWNGTLNASQFGSQCVQGSVSDPKGSEDCLFLNVFRPAVNDDLLPVLLFVHGGSSTSGNGNYNMSELAIRTNSIVITINYRLNVFGFMATKELADETSEYPIGNWGVSDVFAALRWVNSQIALFGGNKNEVVLFGQSSGGTLALAVAVSPYAEGLVNAVYSMSGSAQLDQKVASIYDQNDGFTKATGCDRYTKSEEVVQGLKKLSTEEVYGSMPWNVYPFWSQPTQASVPIPGDYQLAVEVIDGDIVPESIRNALKSGSRAPITIVIGNVNDELTLWNPPSALDIKSSEDASKFLKSNFDKLYHEGAGSVVDGLVKDELTEDASGWWGYQRVGTDVRMICPSRTLLREGSAANISTQYPIYGYIACGTPHSPGVKNPVPHTPNLVRAFHVWDLFTLLRLPFWDFEYEFDEADVKMGDAIAADLVSLAKFGKPALAEWTPFTVDNPIYRTYNGVSGSPTVQLDPHKEACEFYEGGDGHGWEYGMKN